MKFFCAQCSGPLLLNARRCGGCGNVWDHPVPAEDAPGYDGVGAFYWPPRRPSTNEFKARQAIGTWNSINPTAKILGGVGVVVLILLFILVGAINNVRSERGSASSVQASAPTPSYAPRATPPQPNQPAPIQPNSQSQFQAANDAVDRSRKAAQDQAAQAYEAAASSSISCIGTARMTYSNAVTGGASQADINIMSTDLALLQQDYTTMTTSLQNMDSQRRDLGFVVYPDDVSKDIAEVQDYQQKMANMPPPQQY